MKILDTQTGRIHEYGSNPHDSLYVNNDGRYLTYFNLQNGDGSGVGDYRFVCDDGKIPSESETADAIHAEVYFNIGGFDKHSFWIIDEYGRKVCRACQFPFSEFQSLHYCSCCGRKMYSEESNDE